MTANVSKCPDVEMFQVGQTTIERRWKNNQSIDCLKVEREEEDGVGRRPSMSGGGAARGGQGVLCSHSQLLCLS